MINLAGVASRRWSFVPFAEHISSTRSRRISAIADGTFAALRQMMLDAQRLQQLQTMYAANPKGMTRPDADRSLEALFPVVSGKMPIVFNANTEREINRSIDLIKEFKLNGIIAGGQESWKVADRLKAANIPGCFRNFPKRTTATSPMPIQRIWTRCGCGRTLRKGRENSRRLA